MFQTTLFAPTPALPMDVSSFEKSCLPCLRYRQHKQMIMIARKLNMKEARNVIFSHVGISGSSSIYVAASASEMITSLPVIAEIYSATSLPQEKSLP